MAQVLLIGTKETKPTELAALGNALRAQGLTPVMVDVSLRSGDVLAGDAKLALMATRTSEAIAQARSLAPSSLAALGIGGGTGGEMALDVLCALPSDLPRALITTMAFDPRTRLADNAITLMPTLCDIEGMNLTLAQIFARTAAMITGLQHQKAPPPDPRPSIAVSTLGVTGAAGVAIVQGLDRNGLGATVFHANGYGGAAFARFIREGRAQAVIDLNVHELGRMRIAGACAPMPDRFTCAACLPRVVLPGALNFLGLGALDTLAPEYLARPHYRHSGLFTHVQLTENEMTAQAEALAALLNQSTGPTLLLLPMGGFSHEDRPGGAIEAVHLRALAADILTAAARNYQVERLPHHINADQTAQAAVTALLQRMPHD